MEEGCSIILIALVDKPDAASFKECIMKSIVSIVESKNRDELKVEFYL